MMLLLLALCISLIILVIFLFLSRDSKSKIIFEGIPVLTDQHWFFGVLPNALRLDIDSAHRYFAIDNANDEGFTSFWVVNVPVVCVANPKYARAALNAEIQHILPRNYTWHTNHFLGPKNIGFLNNKEWRFFRSAINKAFTSAAVQETRPCMISVCRTLVKSLQRRIEEDVNALSVTMEILPLLRIAAVDIFGLTSLGEEFGGCKTLDPSPVAKSFGFLSDEMTRRIRDPLNPFSAFYFFPTRSNFRHWQERRKMRGLLNHIVKTRKREVAANPNEGKKRTDLLSHLIHAIDVQKASDPTIKEDVSDETFSDILMSLLFAGYDTTSITLSYALYNIAKNPGAEARCVKEVLRVLGKPDDSGKDDLSFDPEDLKYCQAVIYETLRLFPPGTNITRNLTKDLKLGKTVIPERTSIHIPVWGIQRDERNFPRPMEFLPERWVKKSDDSKKDGEDVEIWIERTPDTKAIENRWKNLKKDCNGAVKPETKQKEDNDDIPAADPSAFFAFSAGARSCAGKKFAMQEAVTMLAIFLRHLKFDLIEPEFEVEPERSGLIQKPKYEMPMVISVRKN